MNQATKSNESQARRGVVFKSGHNRGGEEEPVLGSLELRARSALVFHEKPFVQPTDAAQPRQEESMKSNVPKHTALSAAVALALAGAAAVPTLAQAQGVNKNCPEEAVFYNPSNGEDIVVP